MEELILLLKSYAVAGHIQWRRFEDLDGDDLAIAVLNGAGDMLAEAHPFKLRPYEIVLHAARHIEQRRARELRDEGKRQSPLRAVS